jgi:hypothetical protein
MVGTHCATMEVEAVVGTQPLGRPRRKMEDENRMDLREIG